MYAYYLFLLHIYKLYTILYFNGPLILNICSIILVAGFYLPYKKAPNWEVARADDGRDAKKQTNKQKVDSTKRQ